LNANYQALLDHLHEALALSFAPVFLIAVFVAILCSVFGRGVFVLAGFAFGLFGASIGLMLGASRDPAVTAIGPALITLAGGLAVYIFPAEGAGRTLFLDVRDEDKAMTVRGLVFTAIAAIALSSATGAGFGAAMRSSQEAFLREYDRNQLLYEQIELPLERALLERALGLSTEPSGRASQ